MSVKAEDQSAGKDNLNRQALVAGSFFVFVQLLVRGITFLTTPIYTRLVSTQQYGDIRVYESWLLIAVPIMSLCTYRSVPKAKFEFPGRFNQYVSSALTLAYLTTLAMFAIITLFFREWFMEFTDMDTLMYVYMLLYVLACTALYFFQNREMQLMRYQRSTLVTGITMVSATLLSIALLYWGNVSGHQDDLVQLRVIGFYTPQIIGGVIVTLLMMGAGRCAYNSDYWKYAISYSVPFIPDVLSIQIMNQSDKIMMQKMIGGDATGLFSLATTVSFITWILEDAVWTAWRPWLFEKLARDEADDVERPWMNLVVLFCLLAWVLIMMGPEIVLVLGGEKYHESVYLIAPMITGTLYRFFSYAFSAVQSFENKTKYVALGTIIVMVTNVVLNFICIQLVGYQAAAYTTCASYFLLLVVQGVLEMRVTGRRIVSLRKMCLLSAGIFVLNVVSMVSYGWVWYARYVVMLAVGIASLRFVLPIAKGLLAQLKTKSAGA